MNDAMHTIPVTEEEMVKLMLHGPVTFAFGPGWAGLQCRKDQPLPESVRYLGLLRGVTNENTHGAGI